MKNCILPLLLAILFCQADRISAQTATPTYYVAYGYHKVKPGMHDDFLKLAKAWKKIVAWKKKSGMQESWSLSKVVSPTGSSAEYNYVTRHSFTGETQLAAFMEKPFLPDNWQSLLTVDEIELVLRAPEIREFVKTEVWSSLDRIEADDMNKATVDVFNYFKQPEGISQNDHIKMETDIWKPVHSARVKDGNLKGWILMGLEFPFGSSVPYDMATIDVYSDMKQYLTPWFDAYFQKVHAGKNVADLLKQTNAATDLVKADVRITIDKLEW